METLATTKILGEIIKVNKDFSLEIPSKTISKDKMEEIQDAYKGVNRLHKPLVLLFWSDVKNGKKSNWELI